MTTYKHRAKILAKNIQKTLIIYISQSMDTHFDLYVFLLHNILSIYQKKNLVSMKGRTVL